MLWVVSLLGTASLLIAQHEAASISDKSDDVSPIYRLNTTIFPSRYNLTVTLDPNIPDFQGTVNIYMNNTKRENVENVTEVYLHASQEYLTLINVTWHWLNDSVQQISTSFDHLNNESDIVKITFNDNFNVEDGYLHIEYNGTLADDMLGAYRSTYDVQNGNKTEQKYLIATQFEQISARRFLPCFDEPHFKATFDIAITIPKGYAAVSNTPIDNENSGNQQSVFQRTPVMSPYLLAVLVYENASFNKSQTIQINETVGVDKKVPFSIFARSSAQNYLSTALKYGPQLVQAMESWINISYISLGNSKLDLAAIPDFAAGAMENWGLITYREIYLIDEGNVTTKEVEQNILTVIAHELSHQWFGDYVTMDWWSETWLNEGFATYFQHTISNLVDSEMELDKQFIFNVYQKALLADSVLAAIPLSNNASKVNTPAEISKEFDNISYLKGGSIVKMFEKILGEETLKKALNTYLNAFNHTNVESIDLLNALQNSSPQQENLTNHLTAWIDSPGFPLVEVSFDNTTNKIFINNTKRFLTTSNDHLSVWDVPVTYLKSDAEDSSNLAWLAPNQTMEVKLLNNNSWIIVNDKLTGFYRVNYDSILWNNIITALKTKNVSRIDVLTRAQLISDVFNIAKIGQVDYNTAFALANYTRNETEYYPFVSLLDEATYLRGKIQNDTVKTYLENNILFWIENLVKLPKVEEKENLTHIKTLHRNLILQWACALGHKGCIEYAKIEFETYLKEKSVSDNNLRDVILCNGLRNSNSSEDQFNKLFHIFNSTSSPNEQTSLLKALACTTKKDLLKKYLSYSIDENSGIRKQDSSKVFTYVYSTNMEGIEVALDLLDNNISDIIKNYKGMLAINSLMTGVASVIVKEEHIKKLKKIIDDNKDNEEIQNAGAEALEIAKANQAWSKNYADDLAQALNPNKSDNGGDDDNDKGNGNSISSFGLFVVILISIFSTHV